MSTVKYDNILTIKESSPQKLAFSQTDREMRLQWFCLHIIGRWELCMGMTVPVLYLLEKPFHNTVHYCTVHEYDMLKSTLFIVLFCGPSVSYCRYWHIQKRAHQLPSSVILLFSTLCTYCMAVNFWLQQNEQSYWQKCGVEINYKQRSCQLLLIDTVVYCLDPWISSSSIEV